MVSSDSFFKQRHVRRHSFAFSRHAAPEVCKFIGPQKREGAGDPQERAQGRPGARCTRGLACKKVQKTHTSIQVQRRQSGLPCAMVLRLISRSPWRPGCVATIAARMSACRAVRADIAFQRNLTPASGCQDHTTSPSASRAVRQRRIRVHRIPSRICDDRERPSDGTRRAKDAGDLGLRQSGIFFRAGLDRWNQLEAAREIRLPRLCRLASFTLRRCR